ncbi:uncharacterized protein EI90DRAFT_3050000 [Cantharellus anzutake]|uniref:uncharacterized protein n=1 Tax=Cantharellus anzutake TaxID=1750568 RepID=UPI0019053BB8|nr:uncharacterized protein EI90DRAFT_3050000 [Cantharellus anzutake]KAF8334728.1 hypothetical protein EI90DRAFT_3050000 [Cantharellus anzutake]
MRRNFTIDAPNSLIQYSTAGWRLVYAADDPSANFYRNGTAVTSSTPGASATFDFFGTGIWVYGARRDNHGNYTVSLDGGMSIYDGHDPKGAFQVLLFGQSDLPSENHTLTILNSPGPGYFDIDFIIWETSITNGSTQVLIDDTTYSNNTDATSAFRYFPEPTSWTIGYLEPEAYNTTLSSAQKPNALTSLIVPSTADLVAIYGKLGPGHGPYKCVVNKTRGEGPRTIIGNGGMYANPTNQQMLCLFEGLNDGSSPSTNIIVSNEATSPSDPNILSIDYAEVWTAPAEPSQPGPPPPHAQPPPPPGTRSTARPSITNAGTIAGSVIGGLFAVSLAVIAAYVLYRRSQKRTPSQAHRERAATNTGVAPFSKFDPQPPVSVLGHAGHADDIIVEARAPPSPVFNNNPPYAASWEGRSYLAPESSSMSMSGWTAPASQTVRSPSPTPVWLRSPAETLPLYRS